MKKDKLTLIGMATLTILVLATSVLYSVENIFKKEVNPGNLIPFTITLMIVVLMVFFILKRYKDVKSGLPVEDERSRKVVTNAAAKTFYISLYWLLAISWFESFFAKMFGVQKLGASQTVGGGIAGMAIIFFICWFYYNKKGKLV